MPKGCLIGDGVVVGPSAVLEPFERLSRRREPNSASDDEDDEDSDLEEVEASALSRLFRTFNNYWEKIPMQ